MEVVEVEDIEQSPLISRVSNSLRQTRSEENLSTMMDSDPDSCCWSQEDEEISTQVRVQPSVCVLPWRGERV